MEISGRCLCGKVSIQSQAESNVVDACHCSMCRKWSGSPFMGISCGPNINVTGEEHLGVFDSSEWAQRAFCKSCGTHLYYYLKGTSHYSVPAGLLDGEPKLEFKEQIFVDYKPDYYDFANQTEMLTEAEVMAKYAPPES